MGLFYYASANGTDYTISARTRGLSSNGTEMYAKGVDRYLDQRAYLNRMLRLETEPALANATFCALPA